MEQKVEHYCDTTTCIWEGKQKKRRAQVESKIDLSKLKYKIDLEPPSLTCQISKGCESRVHRCSRQLPSHGAITLGLPSPLGYLLPSSKERPIIFLGNECQQRLTRSTPGQNHLRLQNQVQFRSNCKIINALFFFLFILLYKEKYYKNL